MAILLDSVAPLVKMISLGSAPIKSATCCRKRNADLRPRDKTQRIHHSKAPFSRIHRRASKGPQAALLPPPSTAASRLRYGRSFPQRTAALPAGPARTHPPGALGGGLALPSVRVGAGVRVPVAAGQMPVTVGPYGQSQPSCFDRVKMGFVMGFAVGMAAGALFGTFSCLRIGMRGRELMGGVGKTMMQSGGTFGTFMAIGMGIRC
uniref:Reactive oxygen species modulator 1 n=16 Tax=Neognathae TaxID=8825 RepID=A0A8V0ZMC3_CHICK